MFNFKAACLNTTYNTAPASRLNLSAMNMPMFFGFPNLFGFNNFKSGFEFDTQMTKPSIFNSVVPAPKAFTTLKPDFSFSKAYADQKTNTKSNTSLSTLEYNSDKGIKLAQKVSSNAESSSTGYCAKKVKEAIAACGLGAYESGNACDMADILKNNQNFKEINVCGKDLSGLPAGAVIVYDKGAAGYSSKYGHVEIALGDGTAASDFLNSNVRPSDNARVFIPV